MAPGRKRGAKGVKTKSELSLGDLVLAKVKGFPPWPAKISRPEDWEHAPDPKKYFVQFFGTSEIAFVAPADIQAFTSEAKNKLSARCQGKTVKYFAQAVKEICEEFEELQHKKLSGTRDDNGTETLASEEHSLDPVVDEEALGVKGNTGTDKKESNSKLEIKGSSDLGSGAERCSQRQGEVECEDVKPCLSDDVSHSLSPHVSSVKRNKLSPNPTNILKDSVSVSSPSHHSLLKEEGSHGIKMEVRYSDDSLNELTNGHKPKLAMGSKKKSAGAACRNSSSSVPRDHSGEMMQRKFASGGSMKVTSADISRSGSDVGSEKKGKKLLKEKRRSETADDGREDAEINFEEHNEAISRKKMKAQHGREKQKFQTSEASFPVKMSKIAETGNDASMVRARTSRKSESRSPNVLDDKMTGTESKRLTSCGKAENLRPLKVLTSNDESNHSTDEEDLPPTKRHRLALEAMSSSALISENRLGSAASHKNDLVLPDKVRSPAMQLPAKRRAVRLCDDEDDESPKTPIHGGFTSKVSVIPRVSDSKKKPVKHGEGYVHDQLVVKSGPAGNGLKEKVQSGRVPNKVSSPATQLGVEKNARELSAAHISPSPLQLDSEKLPSVEAKPLLVSPKRSLQSIGGTRPPAELQSKNSSKTPGNISQKKTPTRENRSATASDRATSILKESLSERSRPASSAEKRKTTPKSDLRINDSVLVSGTSNENIASLGERLDVSKDNKTSFPVDSKISDSVMSMKHLIAAAQARKRQAHLQNSYGNPLLLSVPDANMPGRSPSPTTATLAFESSNMLQLDLQVLHPTSPCSDVHQFSSVNQHENEDLEERRVSSGHQGTGSSLSGGTEAAVARDAFEGMIETLSRTKESIGRATRLAIDCAKYGIANEVVELLIQKLENESSLHRRVDLFFLVDSITQCSHSQRGIAGASYIPTVQAALPRLIGAAAPAGAGAQENRRQCHKVLRLWLERRILPESVLRRYMDDIGVVNEDTSAALSLRRPTRAERSIDDPIREMEGMVVDEYGSNATFQLPGLLSAAHVFEEEEEYEDNLQVDLCKEFDDTSPSRPSPATSRDPENNIVTPSDRRHCILEDVDGELEMEDVSGHQKDERPLFTNGAFELASFEPNSNGIIESASNISSVPLPPGSPPVNPPPPTSPPPSLPPPPPPTPPPPPPPLSPPPSPPPSTQQHKFPQLPLGPPPPPVGPPPPPVCPPPPPVGPPQPVGPQPSPVGPPLQHVGPHQPPVGPPPPPVGPPPPPVGPPPPLLSQQSFPPQPPLMSQHMPPIPSAMSHSPQSAYQPPASLHEIGVTPAGNQHTHMVSNTHGSHIRSEVLSQQSSRFPPGVSTAREHVGYSSSRHVQYGQNDAYLNPQASQHRQLFLPGSAPFAQRPPHPELPPQQLPSHFSYQNSVQQHQYPPYSLPNFSDGPRRYATDEQWRMQVNEFNVDCPGSGWMPGGKSCPGPPYSHEGYFGPPPERPPAIAVNFQPSAPNTLPSASQIPVHGGPMMPCRSDISAVNWRPA